MDAGTIWGTLFRLLGVVREQTADATPLEFEDTFAHINRYIGLGREDDDDDGSDNDDIQHGMHTQAGAAAAAEAATAATTPAAATVDSGSAVPTRVTQLRRPNVLKLLRLRETTARPLRSPSHLSHKLFASTNTFSAKEKFWVLLERLERELSQHSAQNFATIIREVHDVVAIHSDKFLADFVDVGGLDMLWRMVLKRYQNVGVQKDQKTHHIFFKTIALLRHIAFSNAQAARALSSQDTFICFLFDCLREQGGTSLDYFDAIGQLLEEIIAVRTVPFDLRKVDKFYDLCNQLKPRNLAYFCKLLALLIYDPKERLFGIIDPSDGSNYHKPVVRPNEFRVIDINTDLIISIPGFITRLTELLHISNLHLPSEHIRSNQPDKLSRYLTTIKSKLSNETDENTKEFLSDLSRIVEEHLALNVSDPQQVHAMSISIKTTIIAVFYLEPVFVICQLLKSRRRMDVMLRLINADIVGALITIFQHLDWDAPKHPPDEAMTRLHGPGCECNADLTLKTQFARLIHSLCKVPSSTFSAARLFDTLRSTLSPEDDMQCQKYSPHAVFWCGSDTSLVRKVLAVLRKTPDECGYKIWLSNSLETFLRGALTSDQLMACEAGLLEHVMSELLKDGFLTMGHLQSNFDLLGEIIRFNPVVLMRTLLMMDTAQTKRLISLIETNLIDSNVFVRSFILCVHNIENTAHQIAATTESDFILSHGLVEYFKEHRAHVALLFVKAIKVHEISQETISCVNTAVTIFTLARRDQRLPQVLKDIYTMDPQRNAPGCDSAIGNLKELLEYWLASYQRRVRDCHALELTSHIPLQEWCTTVSEVLDHANNLLTTRMTT